MPGSEGDPNRQGFDLFFGYNCQRHAHNHYPAYLWRNDKRIELDGKQYSHDLMEKEALEFIRANRARPFFLFVPFTIPHAQVQVPEDSLDEYRGKWEESPAAGQKGPGHPTPRAAHAAMITRMDRSVGRIVDLLAELGLEKETLVLFSSDNGGPAGGAGMDGAFFETNGILRGHKGSLFEGGIRVPFIARWPGRIRAGATSDLAGAFQDVLPTFCEIAGAEAPKDVDGVSLAPTLFGSGEQKKREFLYWEFPAGGGWQAVRLGDLKGLRQQLAQKKSEIQLYDLAKDPGEKEDLAAKHPEVVARMARIMVEQHVPSELFPLPGIDPPAKK
jgi:arylsulfatase